jgi:hypothetical protein
MNYKIIIYVVTLTLFSAMIGGGAVYIATNNNKGKSNISDISETISSSSKIEISSSSAASEKTSSSSVSKSLVKETVIVTEEKPTGQKFTGWLGSTNIEMYLNFKQDKITGKYYNSYDKKWYTLDGVYRDNNMGQSGQTGSIELSEFDNNLITGNLNFNLQNPTKYTNQSQQNSIYQNGNDYAYGIPAGVYYTNTIKTMGGYYNDKKYGNYDLFVSSNQADINVFTDKSIEVKVVKVDDGNNGSTTIFEQNGNYFFTFEDWKLPKDIKVGDKLKIIGKIRSYSSSQSIEIQPWKDTFPGVYESTSQGIFQITDLKKI